MGRLGSVATVCVVLLGCGPRVETGGGDSGQGGGTSESMTGSGPTESGVGTTDGDDSPSSPTDDSTGDVAEATGAMETGDTMQSATDSAGGDWESICSLGHVDPGAMSPVKAGDEVGMIPLVVAEVIVNNCGCHLADESADTQMYVLNPFPLATWAAFQDAHASGQPRYEVAFDRVTHNTLPMPPVFPCDHDGQRIDPSDKALLTDWLGQGAPDGATYVPP